MWPEPAPRSRTFLARGSRFLRARLRELAKACELFADDPRSVFAWWKGWDAGHYGRLCSLRDQGIRPGTIYDIGAYDGSWAEMAQAVFSPDHLVLFEPQSHLAGKIRARAEGRHPTWTLVQSALGDARKETEIHVTTLRSASSLLAPQDPSPQAAGITGNFHKESITERPLDAICDEETLPLPDFVKIDVQGYEAKVLRGGPKALSHAQVVVVESSIHPQYQDQPLLPEILKELTQLGFELYDLTESFRWWPGPVWQVDLWMVRRPPAAPR